MFIALPILTRRCPFKRRTATQRFLCLWTLGLACQGLDDVVANLYMNAANTSWLHPLSSSRC